MSNYDPMQYGGKKTTKPPSQRDNWKRQSDFSQQDIDSRLEGFSELKSKDPAKITSTLQPGMQIRYLSYDQRYKKKTLKMGGVLQYVDPQGRFLRLKSMINNKIAPWSVQVGPSTIYYKGMKKNDSRYQGLLDRFESEELLNRYIDLVSGDKVKTITTIVKYCDKYSNGSITELIKQHQKMRRDIRDNGGTTTTTDMF